MEKITVQQLMKLSHDHLVILAAPPGTGKTTLLKFVSTFSEVQTLDTDALGYWTSDRSEWRIDLGALRKYASHIRSGIIAGWSNNIKEVFELAREHGWLLVGWDLVPDERQRIVEVMRQRSLHEAKTVNDAETVIKMCKQAMNYYRKYRFDHLLLPPQEVYIKSNFRFESASGRADYDSDFERVMRIVGSDWENLQDWAAYRLKSDTAKPYYDKIRQLLKLSGDRASSRRSDVESDRDSKSKTSENPQVSDNIN